MDQEQGSTYRYHNCTSEGCLAPKRPITRSTTDALQNKKLTSHLHLCFALSPSAILVRTPEGGPGRSCWRNMLVEKSAGLPVHTTGICICMRRTCNKMTNSVKRGSVSCSYPHDVSGSAPRRATLHACFGEWLYQSTCLFRLALRAWFDTHYVLAFGCTRSRGPPRHPPSSSRPNARRSGLGIGCSLE